jgi:hypothetical protein
MRFTPDDPVRLEDVGQIIQIDRLVFKRALQTFNEGVGKRRGEIKDALNFAPDPSVIELIPNLREIYRQRFSTSGTHCIPTRQHGMKKFPYFIL